MKLSTKFNISAYIVAFSSLALVNYLGALNLGYAIGSFTWAVTTTLIAIGAEANKIEKNWRRY